LSLSSGKKVEEGADFYHVNNRGLLFFRVVVLAKSSEQTRERLNGVRGGGGHAGPEEGEKEKRGTLCAAKSLSGEKGARLVIGETFSS